MISAVGRIPRVVCRRYLLMLPNFTGETMRGRRPLRAFVLASVLLACVVPISATSVVPPLFDELVNNADYIVRAVVVSVTSEVRPLANGSTTIFSRVELAVEETIAGKPPTPLVLEMLGGRVADREIRVTGAPTYKVGDRAIFFVQGNGKQAYPLVRMMHGVYPVEHDKGTGRNFIARSNHSPLMDVADVARPLESASGMSAGRSAEMAMTPEQFTARIQAQVTNPRLREK